MKEFETALKEIAKSAAITKKRFGVSSEEYAKEIAEIDVVRANWKEKQPEKFWNDDDPTYKLMAKKWQKDRDERALPKKRGIL